MTPVCMIEIETKKKRKFPKFSKKSKQENEEKQIQNNGKIIKIKYIFN